MKTAMKNTAQYRRARSTARPRCQRFTFKAVRDAEGEILYYLILPYLWVESENSETPVVEGSYRENYHLTLKTSGEIGICNTCAVGNPADECRWTLSGAITGMTVTNCGESVNLGVDLDEEIVAGVTAYGTDVWHVMPICLNMETAYQMKTNTCGAASSTMMYKYLRPNDATITESVYATGINSYPYINDPEVDNKFTVLSYNGVYLNYLLGLNSDSKYTSKKSTSAINLATLLNESFDHQYPAMIQMKSFEADKSIWGYFASSDENVSGHYVVAKGIFYNPLTNQYEVALNDVHYRFGAPPGNSPNSKTKNIGGRDIVVTLQQLYKVNSQRYNYVLYYTEI